MDTSHGADADSPRATPAKDGSSRGRPRDVVRRAWRAIADELRETGDPQALTAAQMEALAAREERRSTVIRRALPILDVLLVAAVVILPIAALTIGWITGSVAWIVSLASISGAAVAVRRRFPLLSLMTSTAAFTATIVVDQPAGGGLFAVLLCVLAVAWKHTGKVAIACAIAVSITYFLAVATSGEQHPGEPSALINVVLVALAAALGNGVRSGRMYQRSVEQRALQAEASRDEEARHRVIQERVRIARELHDLVGHHVAVISIQAGVAAQTLERDPAVAREALAQVRAAARDTLGETTAVVRVLREDGADLAQTAPTPGLAQLHDLVAAVRTGGFAVRIQVTGRPYTLDPVADVTAYRVIQESLTNAIRHAAEPRATIDLRYADDEVRIDVSNPAFLAADRPLTAQGLPGDPSQAQAFRERAWDGGPSPAATSGTGYGLVGIRERVATASGSFAAGTVGDPGSVGVFFVRVRLPAPRRR